MSQTKSTIVGQVIQQSQVSSWQVTSDANFELVAAYLATFVGEYDPLPKKLEIEAAIIVRQVHLMVRH